MKSTRSLLFSLALWAYSALSVTAQTGNISGIIIDADTKEPIIGALALIQDTRLGGTTDLDGRYIIRNVPSGKVTVVFTYVGYNTVTLKDVEVPPGKTTTLDVVMKEGSIEMEAVTVSAYRESHTMEAVVAEIKTLNQVVSGISSQQIARSVDNTAAQAMQRVPGITIADNRFVLIRGLSERYNNVMINNVMAPSTEVDKRTFSFDLIASSALDRMLIFKSGTPDLPGDFAGGVIKLYTIENVDRDFVKVNVGFGYRNGTTGSGFLQSQGSGTDFLGFDNGFRRLPSDFPTRDAIQSSPRNSPVRIDAAHSLPNNFNASSFTATPDYSFGVTFGRKYALKNNTTLSNITSVNTSMNLQAYQRDFLRYEIWDRQSGNPIQERFNFVDDVYQRDNRLNILSNWKWQINPNHSISFKNLFNQIGENDTNIRNGTDFVQRQGQLLQNYMYGFRSRSIYTGQLEGNHRLDTSNAIKWVAGGSLLYEEEPDLRRFRTFNPNPTVDPNDYRMIMPPSSNLFDTGRYFGDMMEFSLNQGLDYVKRFDQSVVTNVKAGYSVDFRSRSFNSRYFSYLLPGAVHPDTVERLIRLPLTQIFDDNNVRSSQGFILEEGTRPIDSYSARSFTSAAYVSSEMNVGRLNVIGGLRLEYNEQILNSQDDFESIVVQRPTTNILPFMNSTLSLMDDVQMRVAYGRTVNRPEFRELAPFVFYDYKYDAGRSGNPNLTSATIDNIDVRLEYYPRFGEVISIGGFFKYFNDPIENITQITTESPQFFYINADNATSYGVEVEFRKSLLGLTNSSFIDRFSINANASYIYTTVDLGIQAEAQAQVRPLQGQSPYIINAALYYDDAKGRVNANLAYNIIGPRIFSVGDTAFPTIYELPRHSLDLAATYRISKNSSLKVSVQDLLNAPFRFYQDSDENFKITKVDDPIIVFRRGQLVNFSYSFDF